VGVDVEHVEVRTSASMLTQCMARNTPLEGEPDQGAERARTASNRNPKKDSCASTAPPKASPGQTPASSSRWAVGLPSA
jgi:hypothetical protein